MPEITPQLIQIKRGQTANIPALTLEAAEPAFDLAEGKLYIGNGVDKVLINPDQSTHSLTADKLATPVAIAVSGDTTGTANFDGSQAITITTALSATGVGAGTYQKVTVDAKGRVTAGAALIAADIPVITLSKVSDAGTVAGLNTGTASGEIPVLDTNGKLDSSILPAIAITNSFVTTSEAEMLALVVQVGDVAVRNDLEKSFILQNEPATVLTNWLELKTPTDKVSSVNGKTGTVILNAGDVSLGNVTNESKSVMFTSPVFTNTPTAPTPTAGTNTDQLATTAFVVQAMSVIDGGTF